MRAIVTDVPWSVCRCVCPSVRLSVSLSLSVGHKSAPYKNGETDRDVVWVADSDVLKETCVKRGSDPSRERGNLFRRGRAGCGAAFQ